MFSIFPLSDDRVKERIEGARDAAFSYSQVDCTRRQPTRRNANGLVPSDDGWNLDHNHGRLGRGDACWARAVAAMRCWTMFDLGWVNVQDTQAPLEEGQVVAVRIRSLGVHIVALARIVYTIDEPNRFGFAYGTLPSHPERGEERFLIERDEAGEIWYELLATSRPGHPLLWLGYPWVRRQQARFAMDSILAMQRSCEGLGE